MKRLLTDRNLILLLAIALGLALGPVARWAAPLTLPALAVVMAVSAAQVTSADLLPPRRLLRPALLAVVFSYLIGSAVTLALARWLAPDEALWAGFVLAAAVPPGVAVIPFSAILAGDPAFALAGTAGAYLAALGLTPAITLFFLGESAIQPGKLLAIVAQVVAIPLVASRVLRLAPLRAHVERWRGTVVNWGFFVVVFSGVGLNRAVLLSEPRAAGLTLAVAGLSTFGLGALVEVALARLGVRPAGRVTLVLLATIRNSGLAVATALALFGERASLPGAVASAVNVLYLVWLGERARRQRREPVAQR